MEAWLAGPAGPHACLLLGCRMSTALRGLHSSPTSPVFCLPPNPLSPLPSLGPSSNSSLKYDWAIISGGLPTYAVQGPNGTTACSTLPAEGGAPQDLGGPAAEDLVPQVGVGVMVPRASGVFATIICTDSCSVSGVVRRC